MMSMTPMRPSDKEILIKYMESIDVTRAEALRAGLACLLRHPPWPALSASSVPPDPAPAWVFG